MKNFKFTKQLFAAALVAFVGFSSCQKNEMDEVSASLGASTEQELIANACYTSLDDEVKSTVKIGKGNDATFVDVVIADLEVGNDDDYLYVQFTVPAELQTEGNKGITEASFSVNGVTFNQGYVVDDLRRQVLFEIRRDELGVAGSGEVTLTNISLTINPEVNLSGSNGNYSGSFPDYTHPYQACQVLACAHEKEYWKDANNEWSNFSKVDLGYTEVFLRSNLNSSANKNSVKLLQALTVASLNVANVAENANGVEALKKAIADAKLLLNGVDVSKGQEMNGKITPGLIGRLHQIPSCE